MDSRTHQDLQMCHSGGVMLVMEEAGDIDGEIFMPSGLLHCESNCSGSLSLFKILSCERFNKCLIY